MKHKDNDRHTRRELCQWREADGGREFWFRGDGSGSGVKGKHATGDKTDGFRKLTAVGFSFVHMISTLDITYLLRISNTGRSCGGYVQKASPAEILYLLVISNTPEGLKSQVSRCSKPYEIFHTVRIY